MIIDPTKCERCGHPKHIGNDCAAALRARIKGKTDAYRKSLGLEQGQPFTSEMIEKELARHNYPSTNLLTTDMHAREIVKVIAWEKAKHFINHVALDDGDETGRCDECREWGKLG